MTQFFRRSVNIQGHHRRRPNGRIPKKSKSLVVYGAFQSSVSSSAKGGSKRAATKSINAMKSGDKGLLMSSPSNRSSKIAATESRNGMNFGGKGVTDMTSYEVLLRDFNSNYAEQYIQSISLPVSGNEKAEIIVEALKDLILKQGSCYFELSSSHEVLAQEKT